MSPISDVQACIYFPFFHQSWEQSLNKFFNQSLEQTKHTGLLLFVPFLLLGAPGLCLQPARWPVPFGAEPQPLFFSGFVPLSTRRTSSLQKKLPPLLVGKNLETWLTKLNFASLNPFCLSNGLYRPGLQRFAIFFRLLFLSIAQARARQKGLCQGGASAGGGGAVGGWGQEV